MSSNNTRDPHHNVWGGKNNAWGNRNRKKKTSNGQYDGSMSKIGVAIIGGIFLFTLAHYGMDGLLDAIDNINDAKDKVEKVQDFVSDNSYAEDGEVGYNKLGYFIDTDVEIDSGTVKDILDFIAEIKEKLDVDDMNTVIMNYDTLQNDDSYNEKIIQTLSNYSDPVTFVFISNDLFDENVMNDEIERVHNLINNNVTASNTRFTNVKLSARLNSPEKGYITIAITFR